MQNIDNYKNLKDTQKLTLPKVVFVGGKGGVGKSTISSSIALKLANENKKTLLISTDPAHNLSDIFKTSYHAQLKEVYKNLFLLEIDSQKEVEAYIQEVAKSTKKFISPKSYDMLDSYYKNVSRSTEAKESALFDRLINIICNTHNFDNIIIDTAPTGHTMRFFSLSKTLREWNKTLLSAKERDTRLEGIIGNLDDKDSITQKLEKRYLLYTEFNNILKNSEKSGIIFVLNPDSLSLSETKRALNSLALEKISPFCLIVNKMPPNSTDPFFKSRYEGALNALDLIKNELTEHKIIDIALFKSDILELDSLHNISQAFNVYF